ncbi:MAG: DUF1036 domain-containing protein [Flavobacteriales bacterium]|nr:DUF1036 domain-containing protein [Flavobacteriales bacterium]
MSKESLTFWAFSIGAAAITNVPANAALRFKNDCNADVSIALRYFSTVEKVWVTEGWFNAKPGETVVSQGGNLTHRYYYFFAESGDGRFEWDGDNSHCWRVRSVKFYDGNFRFANEPKDWHVECFRQIDTQQYDDYTYTLSCSDPYVPFNPPPLNPDLPPWMTERPEADRPRPTSTPKPRPTPTKSAIDYVYVKKEFAEGQFLAYQFEFFIKNQHPSRAIWVKYESLDWKGDHVSTGKELVEAQDAESIGTEHCTFKSGENCSYRILSVWWAD